MTLRWTLLFGALVGCGSHPSPAVPGPDSSTGLDASKGADARGNDAAHEHDVAQADAKRSRDAGSDARISDAAPLDATSGDTGPPAVRLIGRFDMANPSQPSAEWSASAMEGRFTGTSVAAQIGGNGNYFATVVDGTIGPVVVTNGSASYPVAANLAAGVHG